jgi:hypothetical protein
MNGTVQSGWCVYLLRDAAGAGNQHTGGAPPMTKQASPRQIRKFLGHGQGSRKVRVSRRGIVQYIGSPSGTDRGNDFWHDGRFADEYRVDADGTVHLA